MLLSQVARARAHLRGTWSSPVIFLIDPHYRSSARAALSAEPLVQSNVNRAPIVTSVFRVRETFHSVNIYESSKVVRCASHVEAIAPAPGELWSHRRRAPSSPTLLRRVDRESIASRRRPVFAQWVDDIFSFYLCQVRPRSPMFPRVGGRRARYKFAAKTCREITRFSRVSHGTPANVTVVWKKLRPSPSLIKTRINSHQGKEQPIPGYSDEYWRFAEYICKYTGYIYVRVLYIESLDISVSQRPKQ